MAKNNSTADSSRIGECCTSADSQTGIGCFSIASGYTHGFSTDSPIHLLTPGVCLICEQLRSIADKVIHTRRSNRLIQYQIPARKLSDALKRTRNQILLRLHGFRRTAVRQQYKEEMPREAIARQTPLRLNYSSVI